MKALSMLLWRGYFLGFRFPYLHFCVILTRGFEEACVGVKRLFRAASLRQNVMQNGILAW